MTTMAMIHTSASIPPVKKKKNAEMIEGMNNLTILTFSSLYYSSVRRF
jgi:hypothetical protein